MLHRDRARDVGRRPSAPRLCDQPKSGLRGGSEPVEKIAQGSFSPVARETERSRRRGGRASGSGDDPRWCGTEIHGGRTFTGDRSSIREGTSQLEPSEGASTPASIPISSGEGCVKTSQRSRSWGVRALLGLITVYQRYLSPVMGALGAQCRFHPSCSRYASAVIAEEGVMNGTIRAIARLLRCHPWHPGGFDPPYPRQGPQNDGRRLE